MYDGIEFVICCGGESTRNFPHSKGMPHKSLLPFGDIRLIDYVLKDIVAMGGRHITIVCSSHQVIDSFKRALETDMRVEEKLRNKGKLEIAEALKSTFLPEDVDLKFVLQEKPLGTAHVLYCAQKEIGDRHVVIIFPDDIILSKDPANPHIKKLVDDFLKNPRRILLTGLWREDVSNNAILVNNRIVEKPKNPTSHIAGMSPNVLPNELIKYIIGHAEKRMQLAIETGKEWLYMDSANDFLDDGGEAAGFTAEMFLKSDEDIMMDTGALPLYELAQLYALLNLSEFKEANRALARQLLAE
ncbi:MAG: sugar phosphate nucleotidyltransferase [Alphaproteobacteria bacterium]